MYVPASTARHCSCPGTWPYPSPRSGLLDTLGSEHLRSALSVRAVLCLVDVRDAAAEALAAGAGAGEAPDAGAAPMPPSPLSSETYQVLPATRVEMADTVV